MPAWMPAYIPTMPPVLHMSPAVENMFAFRATAAAAVAAALPPVSTCMRTLITSRGCTAQVAVIAAVAEHINRTGALIVIGGGGGGAFVAGAAMVLAVKIVRRLTAVEPRLGIRRSK